MHVKIFYYTSASSYDLQYCADTRLNNLSLPPMVTLCQPHAQMCRLYTVIGIASCISLSGLRLFKNNSLFECITFPFLVFTGEVFTSTFNANIKDRGRYSSSRHEGQRMLFQHQILRVEGGTLLQYQILRVEVGFQVLGSKGRWRYSRSRHEEQRKLFKYQIFSSKIKRMNESESGLVINMKC